MRRSRALVLSVMGLALLSSVVWLCAGGRADQPGKEPIYVAAAASLAGVMESLAKEFEISHGRPVRVDSASSGMLRSKIQAGARLDVFVSAAGRDMDLLENSGLLDVETRRDLLRNSLVCIVPASSRLPIASAEDLLAPHVRRVAVGDPQHVPVGMYARQALTRMGVWPRLRDKLAPCINTLAALAQVGAAAVQAGIVYRTDAMIAGKVKVAFVFPPETHGRIVYPVCVLNRSERPAAARAFVDFLSSPRAAEIFAAAGFEVAGRGEE